MTDSKVSLDQAVQRLSNTCSHHAESIHTIQQSMVSLQSQFDTRFRTFSDETQQELHTMESNLTANIESLHRGLTDLRQCLQNSSTDRPPDSVTHSQPLNTTSFSNTNSPSRQTNNLPDSAINNTQLTLPTSNIIVVPPISSIPVFSGKSSERPRQFLLRLEEYTRTVNK
jgi:hypothetical protein